MYEAVKKLILRGFAFAALASLMTILNAVSAQAQWTTSGNTTTTPNSVGVGTGDPTQGGTVMSKFTVASPDDTATAFATSNGTLPRFALNNRGDGSWTMYDYFGSRWNTGITQRSGNLGLGTASPQVRLSIGGDGANIYATDAWIENNMHIQGNEVLTQGGGRGRLRVGTAWGYMGLYAESSSASAANDLVLGAGSGNVRVGPNAGIGAPAMNFIVPNGNVGVGTNAPGVKLAVNGTGLNVYNTDAWIENNMHVQGNEVLTQGGGRGRLRVGTAWGYMGLYAESSSASVANDLILGAGSGNVRVGTNRGVGPAMNFLVPNGNVGIGTSTPSAALDVVGNINVSGNINAKYQDVAEWVPSTQKLQAGTVVVLDSKNSNHVLASDKAYDTRVAGVVSAQPGIALGEAGEGKALVATTGRVKVKVDATRAPIQIGDLIVTSDMAGVAMKSEPMNIGGRQIHAPGTIIGKALEPLEKGTGEILVLLSLQ